MKNWGSLLFVIALHCWIASIAFADAPKAVPSISASLPNAVYGKIYAQNLCPQESSNSKCDLKLQLRKGLPFPKGLELDATSGILAGIATASAPKPQDVIYTLVIDARDKDDNLVETFILTLTTSTTSGGSLPTLSPPTQGQGGGGQPATQQQGQQNAAATKFALTQPTFSEAPSDHDTKLKVTATPTSDKGQNAVQILVMPPGSKACDTKTGSVLMLTGANPAAVRADGTADIILAAPIDPNVQICIWQTFTLSDAQTKAGIQLDTANQGSAIVAVSKFVAVKPPQFQPNPAAGDSKITVKAMPSTTGSGATTVQVSLFQLRPAPDYKDEQSNKYYEGDGQTCILELGQLVGTSGGSNPATTSDQGLVTFQLASAVTSGSTLCAYQQVTSGGTKIQDPKQQGSTVIRVPDELDWGRSRAYIAGGVLFANDATGFSSAHTFVSFDYDRAWLLPKCYVSSPAVCPSPKSHSAAWAHFGYPGLNSFFDARLTAIPVATNNPATTTSNQNGQGSSPGNTAQTNQFSTFLTSQKTAKLGTGIYMPFLVTRWLYRGQENAFAIAPLAITGFNTLTGPTQQNVPNPNGGATTTQTFEQLYTYYGYGARLAQYKMYEAENKAPDLQSYIDITYGRYSNLQSYICKPVASKSAVNLFPGSSCAQYATPTMMYFADSRQQLYRLNFEGILKIPFTPMFIGFSANIGPRTFVQRLDTTFQPPDDLRFVFGYRGDLGNLVSKMGIGGDPNKQ